MMTPCGWQDDDDDGAVIRQEVPKSDKLGVADKVPFNLS